MSCSSGPGACLGIVRPAWATWCPFVICGWKFRSRIAEKSLPRSGSHHQSSPRPSELVSDSNQERSILSTPSESFRVIGFFRENRNHSCEWKHAKKDARGVKKRCNFSLLVFVHSNRRLKSVVDSPRESNRTRGNETRRNSTPLRTDQSLEEIKYIKSSYNRLKQFQNKFHNRLISIHLPYRLRTRLTDSPARYADPCSVVIVREIASTWNARDQKFAADREIQANSNFSIR